MSDYSQGKVYLLYIPGLEQYGYIGSTVQTLDQRLNKHKYQKISKAPYQFSSCVLFEEGNEVFIKLLEEYPCETKQQLLEREKFWLSQYPEAVNKNPPILNEEERKARHKEIHLRAYNKNKDHNLAKHREWMAAHKEEESAKQKAKRQADLEAARAKDKESNARRDKEKRKEWKNQKVICSACGLCLSRNNFPTHKKNLHEGTADYTLAT
jgi:hypothetical protein